MGIDSVTIWRSALEQFERLLPMDAASRQCELEALSQRDASLARHVGLLLAAEQAEDGRFRTGGGLDWVLGGTAPAHETTHRAGDSLGAYRLERELGVGGMGEVWLARRADGLFEAPVALKLLHGHLVRSAARERFVREGRILGQLSHPNIARLLDAGETPERELYLAIEYVEGEHLGTWCDRQRLGIDARLRLFLQICDAVSHAHAHLVVHRDLKPSNILVTPEGQAKLLDFGIAKLVESEASPVPQTELTRLAGRVLTPEYAAPEQILGELVTVATDVYSLGVVLYGLLCGHRPYGDPHTHPHQLEQMVLEATPPPPSRALAKGDARAIAEARHDAPQKLRARLAGDLDTITLKALKKAPEARYASVSEFAQDLRRYQQQLPVSARPDRMAYRVGKYVARHRIGVAAALISMVAIIGGLAVATWQAYEARQAAAFAEAQSGRATRIKALLLSIFADQNPTRREDAQAPSPQRIIQRGIAAADAELRDDPELRADFLLDLGELQLAFSDIVGAIDTFGRARRERVAIYGAGSVQEAQAGRRLVTALVRAGRRKEALALGDEILATLARQPGSDSRLEAARLVLFLGPYRAGHAGRDAWIDRMDAARRELEQAPGVDALEVATAWNQEADFLNQLRRNEEAIAAIEQALRLYEEVQGPNGAALVTPLMLKGQLLRRRRDLPSARETLERAVAVAQVQFGSPSVYLANALDELAGTYEDLGQLEQAVETLKQAQASQPATAGHSRINVLKNIGQLELRRGRPVEAEAALRRAFESVKTLQGEEDGYTWFVAAELGRALLMLGRADEAETLQREAVARMEKILGPEAYQNALVLEKLCLTLTSTGRSLEALPGLQRVVALSEGAFSATHPYTVSRRLRWTQASIDSGDADAIAQARRELASLIDITRGEPEHANALVQRATLHRFDLRFDAARADLQAARTLLDAMDPGDADVVELRRRLDTLQTGLAR